MNLMPDALPAVAHTETGDRLGLHLAVPRMKTRQRAQIDAVYTQHY